MNKQERMERTALEKAAGRRRNRRNKALAIIHGEEQFPYVAVVKLEKNNSNKEADWEVICTDTDFAHCERFDVFPSDELKTKLMLLGKM